MADRRTPCWKSFLAIFRRHICGLKRNLEWKWRITCRHRYKTAIFENSRWQTAAILKIALSSYLSRELSDFDQIRYADADIYITRILLDKKSKFCSSRWWTDAILKIVFWLYLGAIMSINAKFGSEIICRYRSHDQNGNFHKFKMADGRHIENRFLAISASF